MEKTREVVYIKSEYDNIFLPMDFETGEMLTHHRDYGPKRVLQQGERVFTKKQLKAFQEKLEQQKRFEGSRQEKFVQQKRGIQYPMGELKQSTLHYLMMLYPLFRYDEKPILINNKKATSATILKFWDLKKDLGTQVLNELVEKEILKVIKGTGNTKYYTSTGKFVIKGQMDDKVDFTVKVFQEKLQEIVEKVEKEIKVYKQKEKIELYPLSLLAALIPFFHFQTFMFCKNYDEDIVKDKKGVLQALEENPNVIKKLPKIMMWRLSTGQDIQKLGRHQQQKIKIYFKILKNAGAMASFGGKEDIIFINPDLVFVSPQYQEGEWYRVIKMLFTQVNSEEVQTSGKKTNKKKEQKAK
ncbi:hypothetical protein P4603_26240 [Priestia aryabhattai]|uniref:hypothetical protein n=1 Tax=Priestia aryabhattai TaxID=412384 RepID=UPI002E1FC791|nr:hypothetical protein [Priestia aryabhattai]